jgi:hypothetical protein
VGKIACRDVDAWATALSDFAHAEKHCIALLPTLQSMR